MNALVSLHGRRFAALVATIASMALLLQYFLLVGGVSDAAGVVDVTVRFASYFTILANLLVACVAGSAALDPGGRRVFSRPDVRGAVALYIGVTGIVYVAILRHLWQPQGAQWWADTGLHYATPLLYVAWWLSAAGHGALQWLDAARWLLFPLGYLLWTFLRGYWVGEYPYPFVDVGALGMATVLRNAGAMLGLFVMLGLLLVLLDRTLARRRRSRANPGP